MRTKVLVLSTFSLCMLCGFGGVAAQMDEETLPYWAESNAYTAELNLSTATLTVMPMDGPTQHIDLSTACPLKQDLDEGVYLLVGTGDDTALYASYPEGGKLAFDQGNVALGSCELGKDAQALRLPANVMLALNHANVGAVYVHP